MKIFFLAALVFGACRPHNPNQTGSSNLNEVRLRLPEKSAFSKDLEKQKLIGMFNAVIESTTKDNPACTSLTERRAWSMTNLSFMVNAQCSYKVQLQVGPDPADGKGAFAALFAGEAELTAATIAASKAKGETSVPITVTVNVTPAGRTQGFIGGTTTVEPLDTSVDMNVQVGDQQNEVVSQRQFDGSKAAILNLIAQSYTIQDFGGDINALVDRSSFDQFVATDTPDGISIRGLWRRDITTLKFDRKASAGACISVSNAILLPSKNIKYNRPNFGTKERLELLIHHAKFLQRSFPCLK